jgi:hypothetical protein
MFVLYLPDNSVLNAPPGTGLRVPFKAGKCQRKRRADSFAEPLAASAFAPAISGGKIELT